MQYKRALAAVARAAGDLLEAAMAVEEIDLATMTPTRQRNLLTEVDLTMHRLAALNESTIAMFERWVRTEPPLKASEQPLYGMTLQDSLELCARRLNDIQFTPGTTVASIRTVLAGMLPGPPVADASPERSTDLARSTETTIPPALLAEIWAMKTPEEGR